MGPSIRSRLIFLISSGLVLMLGVTVTAYLALSVVDQDVGALDHRWLTGTQILGEMSKEVSDFRLAEAYRALSNDPRLAANAERHADAHRNSIEALKNRYVLLVGADHPEGDLRAFDDVWEDYLTIHDAWIRASDSGHVDSATAWGSSLHWRQKAVDDAVAHLVSANGLAANRQAALATRLTQHLKALVLLSLFATLFLTLWLMRKIRREITDPLGAITRALSHLARGDLEVHVPERGRRDEIGEMAEALEVFRANAAELEHAHAATRQAQARADSLARHDALTGLANRRVFTAELDTALRRAQGGPVVFLVMLIDLDRFKPVNDVQGHATGDRVLCEVARRLEQVIDGKGTVARLGGDEFAVITETEADPQTRSLQAAELAAAMLNTLTWPFSTPDCQVRIGASIGIATCPNDGGNPEDIIRAADLAMDRAKDAGRGTFRFFEQGMDEAVRSQAALEEDLRDAIAAGEIRPFYQPLVDLGTRRVIGFEILARWTHPARGPVRPDVFVPIVERLGLIGDLTTSILRQACRDVGGWPADIRAAINISPSQLHDLSLPTKLLSILTAEGLAPSRLEVEVTESALVGDMDTAKWIVQSLQVVGITVSLDDFGTGYSSLYHLRELKFDKLKVDRSFVQTMHSNADSLKIIEAVLGLAKSLNMAVVAEGIEDEATARTLAERGCEFGQGFLFSQAVPADRAAAMLDSGAPLRISA